MRTSNQNKKQANHLSLNPETRRNNFKTWTLLIVLLLFNILFFTSCTDEIVDGDFTISETKYHCEEGKTFEEIMAPDLDSPGVKPNKVWGWYYFFIIDSVIYEGEFPCRYRTHGIEHDPDGNPLGPCKVNGLAVDQFTKPFYLNPVSGTYTHASEIMGYMPVFAQGDTVAIRVDVVDRQILNWWN